MKNRITRQEIKLNPPSNICLLPQKQLSPSSVSLNKSQVWKRVTLLVLQSVTDEAEKWVGRGSTGCDYRTVASHKRQKGKLMPLCTLFTLLPPGKWKVATLLMCSCNDWGKCYCSTGKSSNNPLPLVSREFTYFSSPTERVKGDSFSPKNSLCRPLVAGCSIVSKNTTSSMFVDGTKLIFQVVFNRTDVSLVLIT